jgi:hypothetical protein
LKQIFSYIRLKSTTTFEINEIINSLKLKDSHGYDEVSMRVLKISTPYIISPLNYIFNKTSATGILPDRLKFSEVKPIFKKGDKTDFTNYRPISLLTSFSKIIEKIIYRRLFEHLLINNVLVKEQSGFRENSSTTDMATQGLLNTILLSLDKKNMLVAYFATCRRPLIVSTTIHSWPNYTIMVLLVLLIN